MSPALMAKSTIYAAKEMTSLRSIITLTDPGNIFLDRELLVVRAFHSMPRHLTQQNVKSAKMHFHSLSNISPDAQNNMFLPNVDVYVWTNNHNHMSTPQMTPVLISKGQILTESFITFKSSDYARAVIAWKEPQRDTANQSALKAVIVTNPFYAIKLHNYLSSLIYVK